jgi:hypothetical protein
MMGAGKSRQGGTGCLELEVHLLIHGLDRHCGMALQYRHEHKAVRWGLTEAGPLPASSALKPRPKAAQE